MSYEPKLAVRMAAFALGQTAKINGLTPEDVEDLRARAERDLPSDDELFRAITQFATQYEIHSRDAGKLAEMGCDLVRVVDRLNTPEPPDLGRRDIYG